ncbi:MAG: response regulator [Bacteroidetes bacterium]|nr:response regulator [Bacteroidota bacterium]
MQNYPYILGNILIVEDNEWDRLVAETLLKKEFNVDSVTNATEALEAIEECHYDIILMDINLGSQSMDGIELMQLIRSKPEFAHIKIFAVTAYADNKERFIELGFDELYLKPVIKEEMSEAIFKALKYPSHKSHLRSHHRSAKKSYSYV